MNHDNYETELSEFLEEALVMKGFSHRNILTLHGIVILEFAPYVVIEYMDRGDLKSYVTKVEKVRIYNLLLHFCYILITTINIYFIDMNCNYTV